MFSYFSINAQKYRNRIDSCGHHDFNFWILYVVLLLRNFGHVAYSRRPSTGTYRIHEKLKYKTVR